MSYIINCPFKKFYGSLPGISVLVPTYGRSYLLPQVIESFIKQNYPGNSELIILNDRADQTITYSRFQTYNNISIINEKYHYPTLGDKRNRLIELSKYPYIVFLDDDDIFLPNRLLNGISLLREGFSGSLESHIWLNDGTNELKLERPWSPFATAITEKKAIIDAGGFPSLQINQDVELFRKIVFTHKGYHSETDTGMPTVIYKKPGTSDYLHNGDYTGDKKDNEAAKKHTKDNVDWRIEKGLEPTGIINIVPKWEKDWNSIANEAWTKLKK